MSCNLPPGCTDKDIDDAAPQEERYQCDNCGEWFDPEDDEDSFIGWCGAFGDCCQCGKCRRATDPRRLTLARQRYHELRYAGLGRAEAGDQAAEEYGLIRQELWPDSP